MTVSSQRNYALDLLKCFAALMVVFLHYNKVQGEYGILYSEIVRSLTTWAVPLFFMITGYYLPVIVEKGGQRKQIKKVLKLALGATTFYLAYRLIDASITSSVSEWLATHYTIGTLFAWIVFCDDPTGYHLWYLYALLYSLLFYAGIYHFKLQRSIPILTLLMVLLGLTKIVSVANYLLGIPCIGCGIMVREGKLKIGLRKILFPVSFILVVAQKLFFSSFAIPFSFLLALCMLSWAIDNPSKGEGTAWAYIGMKLSAYIYIFHVFVDNMIGRIITYDTVTLQIARPFIDFASATLFSYIYISLKKMLHGA